MKSRIPILVMALGMTTISVPVQADPPFMVPPFVAFAPTPSAWSADSGTMTNVSSGPKKRLVVPLLYETVPWMSGVFWQWQATLEAGIVTPGSTIQCTMYAVANDTILNQSQPFYFDGTTPNISLGITSTLCRTVYVDCWVPQFAWIGNITWQYLPTLDP